MNLEYLFFGLFFMVIPISSFILYFIKDKKKKRGIIINIVVLINSLIYLSPLIIAYVSTRPNGNMWSENGPGAILWTYLLLIPLCFVIQIILMILKFRFR